MALNSNILFNELKANVFDKKFENINEYRVQIGKTIANHIQEKAIISGIFNGMTTSSVPVPISISGTAKIICPSIVVPNGTANMNIWWQLWCKSILEPNIIINCNVPLVGTGTAILVPLNIILPTDISTIKPIWQPICDSIVSTIKSAIIAPISCILVSPSAVGTFTVSSIS